MDFESFKNIIKKETESKLGTACRVRMDDVMKNNGVLLSGLTVMRDGSSISPTIYLENYYEAYENGQATIGMITDSIIGTYNQNKAALSFDMSCFLNYGSAKENIVLKLINTNKNRELLKDIPHMEFLDLSIAFKYLPADREPCSTSVLIHNAHAQLWGVDAEELYHCALENTQRLLKHEIVSMKDMLSETAEQNDREAQAVDDMVLEDSCRVPMYVLSNRQRTDGAACMVYPHLIENFASAAGCDLYIIPSSVHELLLLPMSNLNDGSYIADMIHDINAAQLLPEEVLSDSLYVYRRKENRIKIFKAGNNAAV